MTDQQLIRNFCIVAHIDHGKSTLADRLLERTATIEERRMTAQALDDMDLERERGVTIKASAVRMVHRDAEGAAHVLNLIDTPGHVDFTYEVSRALQACEGALLVVDATQGVEAQTLANLHLAREAGLAIVPVVNKIDLPAARPDEVAEEVAELLAVDPADVLRVSAKAGTNTDAVLAAVLARVPAPAGRPDAPLRALVFDSHYDPHKGVIAYVRVVDGRVKQGASLRLIASGQRFEPLEIGVFSPAMRPATELGAGEVGYLATGLKAVREAQVGDTVTLLAARDVLPLPGYQPAKPMVFAGLYPLVGDDYGDLRDALDKLRLNDAALLIEPESSAALGMGFRCGFLGMFHMEIVQERLEREYGLALLATAPSVAYLVMSDGGDIFEVDNPAALPDPAEIAEIHEPWMDVVVWCPDAYIGAVMDVVTNRRGEFVELEYVGEGRVSLTYRVPLAEMITEMFDQLKSRTRGYASMDYQFDGYRPGDLVRLDILVNAERLDALSLIVHRDKAYQTGSALTRRLAEVIPRQMFKVPLQAAIGNRIVARETIPALRKDVLAKCYGGDVTRKRKLLERQKAGKRRMKRLGNVEIPQEAFLAVLRLGGDGKDGA